MVRAWCIPASTAPVSSTKRLTKLRVFQIINHAGLNRGGAERLVRGLHEDLLAAGQDARLIALEACDLSALEEALSLGFSNPRDPRTIVALARILRHDLRPGDVVHAHLFPSTLYVSALRQAGLLRAATTMTEHSTWNRRRDTALGRGMDRAIYRGFSQIVAISEATKVELTRLYPAGLNKVSVIENGVQLRFCRMPERASNPEIPLLLSIGRLVRAKNLGKVLQALASLKDRPWHYEIVGDGSMRAELEVLVEQLGLTARVSFSGQQADVTSWLQRADIFLMPSLWEGFGMAAVEAMNAGLPVVASDVPGLREVVAPTGATLVNPENGAELSRAIADLLDHPHKRAALGKRGHDHAQQYDRARMMRAYQALWSEIV